jgi:SAM-dependent methyltransferase
VVAVDGSITLLQHALEADPVRRYTLADARRLPLSSGSVEVAVAYNSLMDVDDLAGTMAEVGRVVTTDGVLCVCITHPMQYTGGFDGDDLEAPYVLSRPYFGVRRFDETFTRNDITMRFRGWDRPIEAYFAALLDAGFVVDAFSEPASQHRRRPLCTLAPVSHVHVPASDQERRAEDQVRGRDRSRQIR